MVIDSPWFDTYISYTYYSNGDWQEFGSTVQAPGLFKARLQVDGEPADTFVYMKVIVTMCSLYTTCKHNLKRLLSGSEGSLFLNLDSVIWYCFLSKTYSRLILGICLKSNLIYMCVGFTIEACILFFSNMM